MSDQDFKPSRAKSSNYVEIMQTYQTASKSCKLRLTGKKKTEKSKLTVGLNINLGCKKQ